MSEKQYFVPAVINNAMMIITITYTAKCILPAVARVQYLSRKQSVSNGE